MNLWPIRMITGFLILVLIGICLLAYGYFIEPHRLVVTHKTIHIKNWDAAFEGLRVAAISDVHGGSNGASAEQLRRVVATTNELEPDLIVLIGDYVSQTGDAGTNRQLRMPVKDIADNLSGLKARYGVLAVLGNHDGWFGDESVRVELERVGYNVLESEVVSIEHGGRTLRILGLQDHLKFQNWQWLSNMGKQALGSDAGNVMVLEHSPDILPMITGELLISADLKLILAGHTHGGQVWLPVFGRPVVPSSYGQKYAYGHVKENGVDMFVTSGIGTSILPFRFLVPPEIALITIKAEK